MTEPLPAAADRRVLRTRRVLRDALLSLLLERGWDDISVHNLCACADIGRSTFYQHFRNKEELLAGSLADLYAVLRAAGGAAGSPPPTLAFARGLIEHIGEQRPLFRAIVGRRGGHVVQTRFREMIGRLVGEDLAPLAPAGWQRDAAARYLAGALVELLAWWVDAGQARSADEVERCFHRLSAPVLAQLAKNGRFGDG